MQDAGADGTGQAAEKTSLTAEEALEYAVQAHRADRLDMAAAVYDRIVAAAPDYAPAFHFYGILHHQTGHTDRAVELVRRAIEIDPSDPAPYNNLGNILSETGRREEAAEAYRNSLALAPDNSDAWSNLGVSLRALGRRDEAEAAYRSAIGADPRHREAYDNLGRLLSSMGRSDEAAACHAKAMELEPRNAESRRMLAAAYAAAGELGKAQRILQDWLDDEPSSPTARHLLAAVSGENVPDRADDIYVETMFDRFATSFDEKLASLEYRAPELVVAALGRTCTPKGSASVLDAGCGTGLCGPLLKPYAQKLVGVDLSGKMLHEAARRRLYDKLVQGELTAFLAAGAGQYDIIVSADTLCYFGALEEVFAAAERALRPDGWLAFTVEAETAEAASRLNPHGRYSHRQDYVERTLRDAGFGDIAVDHQALRTERGEPVMGLVVTARTAAA